MIQPGIEVGTSDAYRALVEQVIAGRGLAGVVHFVADMLGVPAVVADEEFEPLHGFAPRGKHLSPAEAALPPAIRQEVTFDLAQVPQASTAPPTLCLRTGDLCYALAPVVLPAGILAYLWVVDPSGQLSPRIREVVSHASAACALELVRQRAIVEGESRVRSSFLEDLLTGDFSSNNSTRRRASFLGYNLTGEQVIVVLDLDHFATYIEQHQMDETGIQRLKERFRRGLDTSTPAIWSKTLVWEHSDSLVILVPAGKHFDRHSFARRVEALRQAVERRLKGPSISAGLGRPYADLGRLQDSYHEAEHALQIGSVVSGPSATTAFDDLGSYRLLYHLRDQPELRSFYEETTGALDRYDEEHGTNLVETLHTFLELQGNLSQTARALHLHRNGLLYRLTRIQKIVNCDLDNPSQRLALQLSLLARPLLDRRYPVVPPLRPLSEERDADENDAACT